VLFVLNTTARERTIDVRGAFTDLLTGDPVTDIVHLAPEGAAALIERAP
jgi:hypothetical protein